MTTNLTTGFNSLVGHYPFLDEIFTDDILNYNGSYLSQSGISALVTDLLQAVRKEYAQGNMPMAPNTQAFEALHDMAEYCPDVIRLQRFCFQIVDAHVKNDQAALEETTHKIERANTMHDKFYSANEMPAVSANIGMLARMMEASENNPGHKAAVRKDSITLAQTYNKEITSKGGMSITSKSTSSAPDQGTPSGGPNIPGSSTVMRAVSKLSGIMKTFGKQPG